MTFTIFCKRNNLFFNNFLTDGEIKAKQYEKGKDSCLILKYNNHATKMKAFTFSLLGKKED
jgi:hypothetical protein